jgi:hypothetical protein
VDAPGVRAAPRVRADYHYDWKENQVAAVENANVPDSLKEAVRSLSDYVSNYGSGWLFEFPKRNLMEDADGNLVLLDVLYDAEALLANRRAAWAARR